MTELIMVFASVVNTFIEAFYWVKNLPLFIASMLIWTTITTAFDLGDLLTRIENFQ